MAPQLRVAVAGTFGPLHDGHRALFREALRFGTEGVLVALTSDALAQRTRHEPRPVPAHEERAGEVRDTLAALDEWGRDVELRTLTAELEYATSDPTLDALVVSPETADEVAAINEQRRDAELEPLLGLVVPYVLAEDGERISSTRIVRGEIDEHGAVLD